MGLLHRRTRPVMINLLSQHVVGKVTPVYRITYVEPRPTGEEIKKHGATEFVRGSCTDRDWRSGSCPSFCVNPDVSQVQLYP